MRRELRKGEKQKDRKDIKKPQTHSYQLLGGSDIKLQGRVKGQCVCLVVRLLKALAHPGHLPRRDFSSLSLLGTGVGDTGAATSLPWLTGTVGLGGSGAGHPLTRVRPDSPHSKPQDVLKQITFSSLWNNMQISFVCCDIMDTQWDWRGASQNTWGLFKMA